MKQISLETRKREKSGSTESRKLRRSGWLPVSVYGHKTPPICAAVNEREFSKILRALGDENALFSLSFSDGTFTDPFLAVLKEIQRDPVRSSLLHVDFQVIQKDEKIRLSVPVHFKGVEECEGVKLGGVFEALLRSVEVYCFPDRIPEALEVDVRHLAINQSIHVRDLAAPEGVQILNDLESVVALVAPPTKEEEVQPAVAQAAEPEVLTAKNKEEKESETTASKSAPAQEKK